VSLAIMSIFLVNLSDAFFVSKTKWGKSLSGDFRLLHAINRKDDGQSSSVSVYSNKLKILHNSEKLSLAPMMEYTDRHFRYMLRLISKNTLLYSEMVAANALAWEMEEEDDFQIRRFLSQGQMASEGASVLQLGGSDPVQLSKASSIVALDEARRWDYTAINLNCGCPSPKVAGKGCFGAALMKDPKLVKQLTSAMYQGTNGESPITVKCRIGTDDDNFEDDNALYSSMCHFVDTVASNGVVDNFQVHARIAILNRKLSPAQNRSVPPLKYHLVHRLAREFPELRISINGGIDSLQEVLQQYKQCPELSGVMIGRAFAAAPWQFSSADKLLYGLNAEQGTTDTVKHRMELLEKFGKHADREEKIWGAQKIRRMILKAIQPIFHGEKNAKRFRIALDEIGGLPKKDQQGGIDKERPPLSEMIIQAAQEHLSEEVLFGSPEEYYEKSFVANNDNEERSEAVKEWQKLRQQQELSAY